MGQQKTKVRATDSGRNVAVLENLIKCVGGSVANQLLGHPEQYVVRALTRNGNSEAARRLAAQGEGTGCRAYINTRHDQQFGHPLQGPGKPERSGEDVRARTTRIRELRRHWVPSIYRHSIRSTIWGSLYSGQGKLSEAEKMFERALQGYEKAIGRERVNTYIPTLNTKENLDTVEADGQG